MAEVKGSVGRTQKATIKYSVDVLWIFTEENMSEVLHLS